MKKPVKKLTILTAFMILVIPGFLYAGECFGGGYDAIVEGTGDPVVDLPAVQAAVSGGGKVLLKGHFDFGYDIDFMQMPPKLPAVMITTDVEIYGEKCTHKCKSSECEPATIISGGYWTFHAPLPPGVDLDAGPSEPGPKITIKNIHFDGAVWVPLHFAYTSGALIANNKITNVIPWGPFDIFGRPHSYWAGGVYFSTAFVDPRNFIPDIEPAVVPNAVTGCLDFKNNSVDLKYDPENPPPLLAADPPVGLEDIMGQGVFYVWTWGAISNVSNNTFANVTRNTIELLNNYNDESGCGIITIKSNKIVTPEVGITVPSPSTPNGIVVGWFFDPGALDPDLNPRTFIRNNYVDARGDTSIGIIVLSDEQIVRKNHVTVNDGPGAAGILIGGERSFVGRNHITVNHTSGMPGPGGAGAGVFIISDRAFVTRNKITFNGVSPGNGILQIASEGRIALNKIKGSGGVAISLYTGIGPDGIYYTAENNRMLWNRLHEFNAGLVDVAFMGMGPGTGASYNTLIGRGGTVLDMGIENTFRGDWEFLP